MPSASLSAAVPETARIPRKRKPPTGRGFDSLLYSVIQPYSSVSITGMCKNAGKTTVLNRLIAEAERAGETLGLTSIGRDGEKKDLVTDTKKPEIYVRCGTLIATAERALDMGDISREIIGTADMPTPMGNIVLARAMSDGSVQLAGPSMTVWLAEIRDMLLSLGADRVLLDGALGRRSPAAPAVSEGTILCTGASYSPDMMKTVEDTAFTAGLMCLERTELPFHSTPDKFAVFDGGEVVPCAGLRDAADAVRRGGVRGVLMRGGVTDASAAVLMNAGRALRDVELVCEDGSRLLLSGANAERLRRAGARFTALNTTRLLAVTVNPFSAYGEHYDKDAFLTEVRQRIPPEIRVLNVNDERDASHDG